MLENTFCARPYTFFEIGTDGFCYFCSRLWNDSYCIGNILEQSFEEVWNGQKARDFRQSIIDKNYKYCDTHLCLIQSCEPIETSIAEYPEEVSLCYDNTCVQQCLYCRDEPHIMSKEDKAKWDALIEPVLIPMLKNAKLVTVNVAGEVFISEHSKKLIKRIAEVYPNIKFAIITNGILCSEENLKNLGIEDKIVDIRISIPSCIEETYNKIVRNGNFKSVMKNLKYVSELKKQEKIKKLTINCVLTSLNYKDLIPLTKFSNSIDAFLHIMIAKDMGQGTKFLSQLDKYLVTNPTHPEYNNFVKIMNNPIIKNNNKFIINEGFKNLKQNSFQEVIKNKINFHKKYGFS